jgi:hypothetical protein
MNNRRRWKAEVRRCVDLLAKQHFSLTDLYLYKDELRKLFPCNNNVEAKIRQQLQLLRDDEYIESVDNSGKLALPQVDFTAKVAKDARWTQRFRAHCDLCAPFAAFAVKC